MLSLTPSPREACWHHHCLALFVLEANLWQQGCHVVSCLQMLMEFEVESKSAQPGPWHPHDIAQEAHLK